MDCHMARTLSGSFDERLLAALDTGCSPRASLSAAELIPGQVLASQIPKLTRWHTTSQDRLFSHLRTVWADTEPRVMIDLGSHTGHGQHRNLSDALNWLRFFNASGGAIFGIDAVEDYALDLQYRFDDVPPFSSIRIQKRSLNLAVAATDGGRFRIDDRYAAVVSCCSGRASPWCSDWPRLEALGVDHYCRITRQRITPRCLAKANRGSNGEPALPLGLPRPPPSRLNFSQFFIDRSACLGAVCDIFPARQMLLIRNVRVPPQCTSDAAHRLVRRESAVKRGARASPCRPCVPTRCGHHRYTPLGAGSTFSKWTWTSRGARSHSSWH